MIMTLKCIKCKKEKEIKFFVKDSGKKIGYRPTCKDCRNKYLKEWNSKNKDKIKKRNKRYNKKNPEKRKESCHKYYEKTREDPERSKIRSRCSKRWGKTERGKLMRRINENKRRKFVKETDDGTINYESIQELLIKQNFKSAISGESIKQGFHIDHIIPLCEGGKNTILNIQLLTPKENLRKGRKNGI